MLSITKIIRRCAYMCVLSCIISAPSWADICFLPTGACEAGSEKTAIQKTCDQYISEGYYENEQPEMNCSLANIPGCTLYECTAKSCESRAYRYGPTDRENIWPMGYSKETWECESCKQGSKYFWKCSPKPCEGNYKTPDECDKETETFIEPETPTHKSGGESCGLCVLNSEIQCPEGTTDTIPSGCKECDIVSGSNVIGKKCYKCRDIVGYEQEANFLANHDSSCYDYKTRNAADGGLCYKGIKRTCAEGSDQYMDEQIINGKTVCKCENYVYTLAANPTTLRYTAAGGAKDLAITSHRTGNEVEPWDYDISLASCPCSATKSGDKATISCMLNKNEQDQSCAMTIIQVHEDTSVDTITVGIIIEGDSCATGQLSTTCADSKCIAQPNGTTSVAGQTCYNCNNNTCDPGWTPGEPPAPEGYDVVPLESGGKCYKAIVIEPDAEVCPAGYYDVPQSCLDGYRPDKTTRSDGAECYRCVSVECPAGKTCTDDPVCPSGRTCSGKVDCTTIKIGETVKYYDCKCKDSAVNCGEGYDVDRDNCDCTQKDCEGGYDADITSCETGWKLDEPKGKSGDKACNRCIEETCPGGQTCKPWPYCADGTNCTPNPNIECDTIKLGADLMYTNCRCKLSESSRPEGYEFDANRCEFRAAECPIGYKTETTSCPSEGYNLLTSGKSGDADCGKCEAKTCPAGQICTTDPICPNGQSCPNNPDIKCDPILLGDEAKVTNCRCTLSGTKEGYTLDAGYCKWVANTCPAGTATELPEAVCPTGTNGGYHATDTANKAGDKVCKRCDANTCPSGKSCTPSPINPGDGSDATGNPYVGCQKIKLGANWAYYDCTCNISDQACGNGKKANTRACACESCEGKIQSEISGPVTCEKITCGGQVRYKNCIPWGSQWSTSPNSACNPSKVSDDGKTYFDNSEVCQCRKGTLSTSCGGKCGSSEKCVNNGTTTEDNKACYECKNDDCGMLYVSNPQECNKLDEDVVRDNHGNITYNIISVKAQESHTTDAGTKCYSCARKCIPGECDTSEFPYKESEFIKNSSELYATCDPGCDGAKRYKCAGGATPQKQPDGKTVCVKTGGSTSGKSKSDCDKEAPSSAGWEYLGKDYQGTEAAGANVLKYKWPDYKYEVKSCGVYMYGRKHSTVCNVYNTCYDYSDNLKCFQTNQVYNMENNGFCCATSGRKTDVRQNYGITMSVDEYCCYKGEGCPTNRIATSAPQPVQSKCSKGVEVPKSQMANYQKACGDSKMKPECSAPASDSDYLCCTCTKP